ncbi:csn protein [Levilactobacillus senmaizukei DSM 21775 = NBRC 103853]|uniref:Chitosanase n=1 Tax=Levilactobacillus senmaizukei DSM 21775 = NBRC 103853 TaxID=1423803 RepID=A0A0R2DD47_9LACO|nr:chitosanase [Levilactobacillus senmaizukei]KRN01817.1 csn protein [Levilactobacillus senmaizukei DSM 21775 = NBRC 103853]
MIGKRVTGLICLVLMLGGLAACAAQTKVPGYRTGRTIATGRLRDTTFSLVASAENSTTDYQRQYGYIEDIGDGRGYTAGIIGFTSGTGDLAQVVATYVKLKPKNNGLRQYLPALKRVNGTASHRGLGPGFVRAWQQAGHDRQLVVAENQELDRLYLRPVLRAAQQDDLSPLGQYIYYDAIVVHGPGKDTSSFGGIRRRAKQLARTPAQGGDQAHYLRVFLRERTKVMKQEAAHKDLSRLTTQRQFIHDGRYDLRRPLRWQMYGDRYQLR